MIVVTMKGNTATTIRPEDKDEETSEPRVNNFRQEKARLPVMNMT